MNPAIVPVPTPVPGNWLSGIALPAGAIMALVGSSEARRVGEECSSRWSPYQ